MRMWGGGGAQSSAGGGGHAPPSATVSRHLQLKEYGMLVVCGTKLPLAVDHKVTHTSYTRHTHTHVPSDSSGRWSDGNFVDDSL